MVFLGVVLSSVICWLKIEICLSDGLHVYFAKLPSLKRLHSLG